MSFSFIKQVPVCHHLKPKLRSDKRTSLTLEFFISRIGGTIRYTTNTVLTIIISIIIVVCDCITIDEFSDKVCGRDIVEQIRSVVSIYDNNWGKKSTPLKPCLSKLLNRFQYGDPSFSRD